MAILKTSSINTTRDRARVARGLECVGSREGARAIVNLLERLEAPRYDHAADLLPVSGAILVFESGDPVPVPLNLELELEEPRPGMIVGPNARRLLAEGSARALREAVKARELEAVTGPEEEAAAAYRAQVSAGRQYGHDYRPEVWRVTHYEEHVQHGPTRVSRLYVGTIAALRRNFPDYFERERMRSAGVLGVPVFEVEPAPGVVVDADGTKHARMAVHPAGHELPQTPIRMRRVGTLNAAGEFEPYAPAETAAPSPTS